jgi:hypothetical protein
MVSNEVVHYDDIDDNIIKIRTEDNDHIYCFVPYEIFSLLKEEDNVILPYIGREVDKAQLMKLLESGYSEWLVDQHSQLMKYNNNIMANSDIREVVELIKKKVYDPNFKEPARCKYELVGQGSYGVVYLVIESSEKNTFERR